MMQPAVSAENFCLYTSCTSAITASFPNFEVPAFVQGNATLLSPIPQAMQESTTAESLIGREHDVIYQTYNRMPVVIDRAEGCHIYDVEGKVYLDFLGGIAVNSLGHSHPRIIEAIEQQARKYLHVSNFFYQEPQVRLAELLKAQTGYSKVVYSNSGAEAWEAALKLARKYGSLHNKTGDVIGFSGGFHGRTYGALSVMDKPLYKDGMGPFLPNTRVLPFNDSQALRNAVDETTCALGLEFLQGEGGITEATEDFVATIQELKERFGFVLIADEVQGGTGRTGDFFSFERHNIKPDIVTMAKGIGGGLPLGAVLVSEELSTVWGKGQHGTTYGGNALACATGIVVMEEIHNGLMQQVRRVGNYLQTQLQSLHALYPNYITELRGRGLMQGVVVQGEAAPLHKALLNRRVITSATAGNVIRIVPPLIVTEGDVDEFIAVFRDALAEVADSTPTA